MIMLKPFEPSSMRLRQWLVGLLLVPVVAMAASADAAGPEVAVVKAAPQAVAVGFEFDGVVEPVKQSTVSAQASGRVVQLAVTAGDRVRAGQLLATIDDRESRTGLQRSQAQVAQADAELRNAQAHARRTRELEAKGFVSRAALDTAEASLKAAQAARDQATAGQRQSALAQGFTRVTAPYDGWVRETLVQPGDLAVPGKPWFGPAGELLGLAYLKQGNEKLAGPLFASIARDKDAPETLRRRARQMAGVLGVDAIDDPEKLLKEDAGPAQ